MDISPPTSIEGGGEGGRCEYITTNKHRGRGRGWEMDISPPPSEREGERVGDGYITTTKHRGRGRG